MTNAKVQGELWGKAPQAWADIQEPFHLPLWEAMLEATKVSSETQFFDAGCGGAGASVLAAKRGAQVSGLDAAKGLIRVARERVPDADFRVGDLESLPFKDGAFDVVFAANALQYVEDRIATITEFSRVCKPEGLIVAGLFGPPEKVAFSLVQKAVRETLPEPPGVAVQNSLSAPGKLASLLTDAGLKVVEQGEVDCPFSYPDFETYWQGQVSAGPFQKALQSVSEDKLKTAVQRATDSFRLQDGTILIQPNTYIYVVATL